MKFWAIKVAASIRREGVVEVLQRLIQQHRLLRTIRVDDGPELTFNLLEQWDEGDCLKTFEWVVVTIPQ